MDFTAKSPTNDTYNTNMREMNNLFDANYIKIYDLVENMILSQGKQNFNIYIMKNTILNRLKELDIWQ